MLGAGPSSQRRVPSTVQKRQTPPERYLALCVCVCVCVCWGASHPNPSHCLPVYSPLPAKSLPSSERKMCVGTLRTIRETLRF